MDDKEMEKVEKSAENRRVGNIQMEPKKKLNKALIITAIVLGIIVIAMVVFALVNKLNTNVYSNVYINGMDMGGKTEQEVVDSIKVLGEQFNKKTISIKHEGKVVMEITPASIDMSLDEQKTANGVMGYGRTENLVVNNVTILKTLFKEAEITPSYIYSDAKLTNIAAEITSGIEERVQDDSYSVDEENYVLVITKGKSGKDIVIEDFKADILAALKDNVTTEYTLKLEERKPNTLDIDVVHAKVCRQAKDAYVDETVKPVVYHKHEMGISFDKEKLRQELNKVENQAEGKIIRFKLTATEPKVKIQDITKNIYKDKLATHTSSYVTSDSNRASNLVLGASMLNGTIVMPGETFSFNATMGDCGLSSRGFKPAAVFKGGKVVQEVGGGICQISSTLYVAALYANLDIVSRSNHALPVGYVPVSLDATVYYPYLDFKFKNTREYPIKIVATTTSSRKLTIAIYGTKQDKEYDVELTSWVTSSIPSKVEEQQDKTLAKGKTKVIQSGSAGYTSVAYKTVKYNGKVISKVMLSQDSYGSTPKIIAVGTKVVASNTDKNNNNNNTTTTPPVVDNTENTTPGGSTDVPTGGDIGDNTDSTTPDTPIEGENVQPTT